VTIVVGDVAGGQRDKESDNAGWDLSEATRVGTGKHGAGKRKPFSRVLVGCRLQCF
jgi:hypothetical protein